MARAKAQGPERSTGSPRTEASPSVPHWPCARSVHRGDAGAGLPAPHQHGELQDAQLRAGRRAPLLARAKASSGSAASQQSCATCCSRRQWHQAVPTGSSSTHELVCAWPTLGSSQPISSLSRSLGPLQVLPRHGHCGRDQHRGGPCQVPAVGGAGHAHKGANEAQHQKALLCRRQRGQGAAQGGVAALPGHRKGVGGGRGARTSPQQPQERGSGAHCCTPHTSACCCFSHLWVGATGLDARIGRGRRTRKKPWTSRP